MEINQLPELDLSDGLIDSQCAKTYDASEDRENNGGKETIRTQAASWEI
ncbi:MAG: hypothetical protein V3V22_07305 [Methylococcales bacterium]